MSNMDTKGYTNDELSTLIEWIGRNDWLLKHTISIKKANTDCLTEVDTELITDLDKNKALLIEVKIEEPTFFPNTKNITLDALSSFKFKDTKDKKYVFFDYKELCELININKKGTFFDAKADIILKKVKNSSIILAYNNHIITSPEFQNYIINHYKVKVNPKKDYGLKDTWESAFFCVPIFDKELNKALILGEKDFKNIYTLIEEKNKRNSEEDLVKEMVEKIIEDQDLIENVLDNIKEEIENSSEKPSETVELEDKKEDDMQDYKYLAGKHNSKFENNYYHIKDGCKYSSESRNPIKFQTKEEAESKGYTFCTMCNKNKKE